MSAPNDGPTPEPQGSPDPIDPVDPIADLTIERQIAVFLSGFNAETIDAGEELAPDAEGHILTAAVLRRAAVDRSMVPVRVRVAHGVAAQTAAGMLRKMADMIEREPGFLSSRPGTALRRLPDGDVLRKRLTPEGILAAADRLSQTDRERLLGSIEQIRAELSDDGVLGDDTD
jgi:hypothetical protein